VQAVASGIFGVPVSVPSPGEYVALGAARQAAWVLAASRGQGVDEAPEWKVAAEAVPEAGGEWAAEVRDAYSRLRRTMHGI
jgi:xylulokinase